MLELLDAVEKKSEQLTGQLSDPKIIADHRTFTRLSRESKELLQIIGIGRKYRQLLTTIEEAKKIQAESDDAELKELAAIELVDAEQEIEAVSDQLKLMLTPKNPNDRKNCIMEIRAGTGGDEAALFTADLFRMYNRYADEKGFKTEVLTSNQIGVGGFKEIVFSVNGPDAYGELKFESGVHRVQRVPETESSGRIHTSAASVAVLPEADEIDVGLKPEDYRVDVYRSSGPGGQSVNTTDSAVRITHLPTGIVVSCQDEKSQLKNKNKAMKVLRARLLAKAESEQHEKIADARRSMVGSGDRSAKIRTYNFPQGRVTDHRINLTLHKLDSILQGELSELISALKARDQEERLKQAGELSEAS